LALEPIWVAHGWVRIYVLFTLIFYSCDDFLDCLRVIVSYRCGVDLYRDGCPYDDYHDVDRGLGSSMS
jgi:hypothetical protein